MAQSNELRVFISSTFRDLQEEREHLVKKIFPEIRALCRERGIIFTEVDLRWGLTDEDVALGQVIRTCLEEVDKCRPYFIGITGERYGYIPTHLDIYKDPAVLQHYPWVEEAVLDQMSITEMEAHHGVLRERTQEGDRQGRALFYFRRHRENLEETTGIDEERQRLEAYQQRIRHSGVDVEQFRDPASLGELIHDDLIRIIKRDFADARPPTPLEQERARHEAFSLSRRRAYIPNPIYLKRLSDHVASDDAPLVVYAESGSGKSSLFAYWAEQYRRKFPDAHVIEHYVGIGATATDHYGVIRHVCMEIKERFNREEEIPTEPAKLEAALGQWLGYADHELTKRGERMVVILDGLNQLQGTALGLKWIPDVISPAIGLVLGSTVEGTLVELRKRGWGEFGMQALSEAEREAVVVRYLAEYHKALSPEQIKRIAGDYKCGHPLFLKTLLEELRLVGQHEVLDERIGSYLDTTGTEDLFQRVLERLEDDYSQRAVREVMMLLGASRSGLDEREVSEISRLARLKIATMIAGLDYHLVRKEGRLTFFHDYLRRAVEKRYLGDEQIQRRTHVRLAEYFERSEMTQHNASERAWQYAQAGDEAKLVATLGNLDVLRLLYEGAGVEEVLTHWARLREVGHDPEAIYCASLDGTGDTEAEEQMQSLEKITSVLGRLGVWSGALEISRRLFVLASEGGFEVEGLRAEVSLGQVLQVRGEYDEAMEHLEHAVHRYEDLGDRHGLSRAIGNMGGVYYSRGEYDRALECHLRKLTICEELGDRSGISLAIGNMGNVYYDRGEYDRALECHQRKLTICEELGDRSGISLAIGNIGVVYYSRGEYDRALECYRRQLTISEELGDRNGASYAVGNMGIVYDNRGEYDRALECYQRALKIAEEMGDRRGISLSIGNIGIVYSRRGEYDRALECFQQQLATSEDLGNRTSASIAIENMGNVYFGRGEYDRALECYQRALQGYRTIGYRRAMTYCLSGRARLLLECVELQAMPEYLPKYLPKYLREISEETWRVETLRAARADAEQCRIISEELSKPDTLFSSAVLLSQLDAAEGDQEGAVERMRAMLVDAGDNYQRADLHYWLFRAEGRGQRAKEEEAHRSEALRLYEMLFATTPNHDYRQRIEELTTSKQETSNAPE